MKLDYLNYMLVIVFGVVMALLVFLKLIFGFNIDSDWFWFMAGLGIAVEGFIALRKQMKFDSKFKIIRRVQQNLKDKISKL